MPKNLSNIKTIAEIQLAELSKATEGKSFLVPHFMRIYQLIHDLASEDVGVSEMEQVAKPVPPAGGTRATIPKR